MKIRSNILADVANNQAITFGPTCDTATTTTGTGTGTCTGAGSSSDSSATVHDPTATAPPPAPTDIDLMRFSPARKRVIPVPDCVLADSTFTPVFIDADDSDEVKAVGGAQPIPERVQWMTQLSTLLYESLTDTSVLPSELVPTIVMYCSPPAAQYMHWMVAHASALTAKRSVESEQLFRARLLSQPLPLPPPLPSPPAITAGTGTGPDSDTGTTDSARSDTGKSGVPCTRHPQSGWMEPDDLNSVRHSDCGRVAFVTLMCSHWEEVCHSRPGYSRVNRTDMQVWWLSRLWAAAQRDAFAVPDRPHHNAHTDTATESSEKLPPPPPPPLPAPQPQWCSMSMWHARVPRSHYARTTQTNIRWVAADESIGIEFCFQRDWAQWFSL